MHIYKYMNTRTFVLTTMPLLSCCCYYSFSSFFFHCTGLWQLRTMVQLAMIHNQWNLHYNTVFHLISSSSFFRFSLVYLYLYTYQSYMFWFLNYANSKHLATAFKQITVFKPKFWNFVIHRNFHLSHSSILFIRILTLQLLYWQNQCLILFTSLRVRLYLPHPSGNNKSYTALKHLNQSFSQSFTTLK